MFRKFAMFGLMAVAILASGCTRIETGEVGMRIGWDRQIETQEIPAGSLRQTVVGTILHVPVKDVNATLENIPVVSADNSTMADFDMSVIYALNPGQVAELYSKKSKSFNSMSADGEDLLLMYNWITQTARNAAYKAARKHEALTMNDKRAELEADIQAEMQRVLREEGLDSAITLSQVQVRTIQPAASIVNSANELVRAKNELARKEVEVNTAKAEARRVEALNASQGAIEYMNAESRKLIAQGIANCKANVVVPYDFKGIVNAK